MHRLCRCLTRPPVAEPGIGIAQARRVDPASIDLQLRVILVTTRAALRHAGGDPAERRATLLRGRELIEGLGRRTDPASRPTIEAACAELDELARP